jgi:anaerobic selenocysteine-containing dehydrogenase
VSQTVGLPAEEIERFARAYATTQPSLLQPLIGIEHHRNGAMQFRTSRPAVLSGSVHWVAAHGRPMRFSSGCSHGAC